jgi:hypothetical protein
MISWWLDPELDGAAGRADDKRRVAGFFEGWE